jgi:hypothetical protein
MNRSKEVENKCRVHGHIVLDYEFPVEDATVKLYSKAFATTETILLSQRRRINNETSG